MRIYFAGKIAKNDWRHSIVSGISKGFVTDSFCPSGRLVNPQPWRILEGAIFGTHDYTGPYFIRCDHGCCHGDKTHGCADDYGDNHGADTRLSGEAARFVHDQCLAAIRKSDLLFAWHDSDNYDFHGTLFELGYAHALKKRIVWSCPEPGRGDLYPDCWFAEKACETMYGETPSVCLASCLGIQASMAQGVVYFIESVGTGHIKIGWTANTPQSRLKSLQTGSASLLRLAGAIRGNQSLEIDLHKRFANLRFNGEWFHGTTELRDYITKNAFSA